MSGPARTDFDLALQRLEGLLAQLEQSSDARAVTASREVVSLLLQLHRVGLETLLGVDGVADRCARDPLLNSLLLLHDLHPTPLLERARAAVRGKAGVGAVSVEDGVVVVVVDNVADKSAGAVVKAVEDALVEAVPDAAAVRFVGSAAASALGLVQLSKKTAAPKPAQKETA